MFYFEKLPDSFPSFVHLFSLTRDSEIKTRNLLENESTSITEELLLFIGKEPQREEQLTDNTWNRHLTYTNAALHSTGRRVHEAVKH